MAELNEMVQYFTSMEGRCGRIAAGQQVLKLNSSEILFSLYSLTNKDIEGAKQRAAS